MKSVQYGTKMSYRTFALFLVGFVALTGGLVGALIAAIYGTSVATCLPHWENCDLDAATGVGGCEVNLFYNNSHCGACGIECNSTNEGCILGNCTACYPISSIATELQFEIETEGILYVTASPTPVAPYFFTLPSNATNFTHTAPYCNDANVIQAYGTDMGAFAGPFYVCFTEFFLGSNDSIVAAICNITDEVQNCSSVILRGNDAMATNVPFCVVIPALVGIVPNFGGIALLQQTGDELTSGVIGFVSSVAPPASWTLYTDSVLVPSAKRLGTSGIRSIQKTHAPWKQVLNKVVY